MKDGFRVWDEKEKRYVEDIAIACNGILIDISDQDIYHVTADPTRYVVEEATGYTDDDGNLVYRNDIVAYGEHHTSNMGAVDWDDEAGQWVIKPNGSDCYEELGWSICNGCCITGTVHGERPKE